MSASFSIVLVGGGVAGTSCARTLCSNAPNASVCIVSPSETLKTLKVVKRGSDRLDELTVIEEPVSTFDDANLRVVRDHVVGVETKEKVVVLSGGLKSSYGKLCICTGASPKAHLSA